MANAFANAGLPFQAIAVIDRSSERADAARQRGFRIVCGDAADQARLRVAGAGTASEIIICVSDCTAPAVAAAARSIAPEAVIKALVEEPGTATAVTAAGANLALVLSEIAGQLLAKTALLPAPGSGSR